MVEKPSYEDLEQRVQELEKEILKLRLVNNAVGGAEENIYGFLDELRDGFFVSDSQGFITYANVALSNSFGYKNPQEAVGKHFSEHLSPKVTEEITEKFNRAIRDKDYSELVEFPAIRKDGSTVFVQLKHSPVIDEGKIVGTKGIIRDVTASKKAEKALLKGERWTRALLDAITESVFLIDTEGTIQAVNKTAAERFNGTVDTFTGLCIRDLVPPHLAKSRLAKHEEVFRSGLPLRAEDERDGDTYDTNIYPICDGDGKVTALAIYSMRITEQKRALNALRESEERYRILFEDNQLTMLLVDPDTDNIVDANPAASAFYGYSHEELTNKKITDINTLPHEQVREVIEGVKHQAKRHFFFPHRLSNGEIRKVESFIGPITLNGKQLLYSMIVDVTERVRAEEALMGSEGRLRTLLNAITETAILVDSEGTIQAINTTGAQRFGGTAESLTGTCLWDLIPTHVTDARKSRLENAVKSGAPVRFEHEREGESYNTNLYPMFDSEGKIKTFAIFSIQITEQKKALESLRESEERYRSLFEENRSTMLLVDPDTSSIVDANPAACAFYGYSREEIKTKKITDINILPRDQIREQVRGLESISRKSFSFAHRLANGEIRNVESFIGPITLNRKRLTYTIVHDVTERVRAEEALRESEEKNRLLIESLNDGLLVLDKNDSITYVNDRFLDMIGYTRDELIGKNPEHICNEDSWVLSKKQIAERRKGKKGFYETSWNKKHGGQVPTIKSASPIFNDDGQYEGSFAVIIDITEMKKIEHALRQSEKELKAKTNNLEEVNAALRVLLEQREKDKTEIEQKLLFNVKELVIPYLEKIKNSGLDTNQNGHLSILESNLNDIISPFSRTLSLKFMSLTPTEIQVANLIKQGRTTKEIADSFHISSKTIEDHRKNIRKKLEITNRKTNLRTHLLAMQ